MRLTLALFSLVLLLAYRFYFNTYTYWARTGSVPWASSTADCKHQGNRHSGSRIPKPSSEERAAFTVTNPKLAKKLKMKILRDDWTDFFLSVVKPALSGMTLWTSPPSGGRSSRQGGSKFDLSHNWTLEQMAAQAIVFFLAGFETSSSTMSSCKYELALQPEI